MTPKRPSEPNQLAKSIIDIWPTHWKASRFAAAGRRYEWDIEPDDADHPTIHGLRGSGILAHAEQGYEVDQIANDIGMSHQNVDHYMHFRDQMKVGADGQKRLHLVGETGVDHER